MSLLVNNVAGYMSKYKNVSQHVSSKIPYPVLNRAFERISRHAARVNSYFIVIRNRKFRNSVSALKIAGLYEFWFFLNWYLVDQLKNKSTLAALESFRRWISNNFERLWDNAEHSDDWKCLWSSNQRLMIQHWSSFSHLFSLIICDIDSENH